ncbi:MAG: phosphatidylinositol mannoside acyltransferase [Acidimicrobiia bacterium]|nr:phosphatidylinositol mannoside acyltransferase [Acidimicrobiia bacterium]
MPSRSLLTFKAASLAARAVPLGPLQSAADHAARRLAPRFLPDKADQLTRHIRRVDPTLSTSEAEAAMRRGLGSYARYWVESFRLPHAGARAVAEGITVIGYEHVQASLDAGLGPILVLPHLGAWEWAAAWLHHVKHERVAAVVERLEPADVFDWFAELRRGYGIDVIPVGTDAMARLVKAVNNRDIVCLLADRDLNGSGVEVELFGETTTLPAGPALLARRTGAPLLPTAVYYRGDGHRIGLVLPAVTADPTAKLRPEVARVTQELARNLERLISAAPDQWHLLEPNWPSDQDVAKQG